MEMTSLESLQNELQEATTMETVKVEQEVYREVNEIAGVHQQRINQNRLPSNLSNNKTSTMSSGSADLTTVLGESSSTTTVLLESSSPTVLPQENDEPAILPPDSPTSQLPLRCQGCRKRLDETIPTDPELASLQILYMTCTSCRTKFDYMSTASDAMRKQEKINLPFQLEINNDNSGGDSNDAVSVPSLFSRLKIILALIFHGVFWNWGDNSISRNNKQKQENTEEGFEQV